jgi:hypothetical protein
MKTTIEIPDALYKRAKIRAVETGQTLRSLMLTGLNSELSSPVSEGSEQDRRWAHRRLIPAFEKAAKAGAYRPGPGSRSITDMISEDRDAR